MSAWIALTKRLHAIGGGPARYWQFDVSSNTRSVEALKRARDMGVLQKLGKERRYVVTPLGRDLCEGRAKIVRIDGTARMRIVPIIGETVPDRLMLELLQQAGRKMGEPVTYEVLRDYSAALVRVARASVAV